MTILWVALVLLAVAAVAFTVLRPPRVRAAGREREVSSASPRRESLLQIALPDSGVCCAAARSIETHRFHKEHAPPLPLADCSMKPGCHCRYRLVPDRRTGERRAGGEKREAVRFEQDPRRKNQGRRAPDNLWSSDGE